MTAIEKAKLHIYSDIDSDGTKEHGIFEMAGDLEVTPSLRTGYVIGGRGSTVNNILGDVTGAGGGERKGVFVDLGGGAQVVEVQFRGWEGARDDQGNALQWGDTGDESTTTKYDTTGEKAITQLECLFFWLSNSQIDSRNPAVLEYGEHNDEGGLYSPLDVVLEQPNMTKSAEDGSWFDGTLTFVSAADLGNRIDALARGGQ